jgi:hypothetical protein
MGQKWAKVAQSTTQRHSITETSEECQDVVFCGFSSCDQVLSDESIYDISGVKWQQNSKTTSFVRQRVRTRRQFRSIWWLDGRLFRLAKRDLINFQNSLAERADIPGCRDRVDEGAGFLAGRYLFRLV